MATKDVKTQIGIDQLLTLSLQGLDGLFFKAHKEKAKKLYKEIHEGRVVNFGSLNFKDNQLLPIKLKLSLDYSQFVGHLTFHVFKVALQQTLRHVAQKLEKHADLNIFTADASDEIVVLTPGIIQQGDIVNVMAIGITPSSQAAIVKLQFLDPEQFKKPVAQAEQADQIVKVSEEKSE